MPYLTINNHISEGLESNVLSGIIGHICLPIMLRIKNPLVPSALSCSWQKSNTITVRLLALSNPFILTNLCIITQYFVTL